MDREILLRSIPKMDMILSREAIAGSGLPYAVLKKAARDFLDGLRGQILNGEAELVPQLDCIDREIISQAQSLTAPRLRRVINATGIVLHTNLGRAPLGNDILSAAFEAACAYCNLEYDIKSGERGSRYTHLESILTELTGAEAVMVTNNNAAAVFLVLNSLFNGRGVAVSRGELVEIGGSFRVPDIMAGSGARLVEVGTTNKTRASDYSAAVESGQAEALLKVHQSNFKIVGFTEETTLGELSEIALRKSVPLIYDLGAGLLQPLPFDRESVETVRDCIAYGADIVCFSGDKLMGSTQAGIILGKKRYIEVMRTNPYARMFRPDKLTLAVLESTLIQYRDPGNAAEKIPALKMMSAKPEELKIEAERLRGMLLEKCPQWHISLEECVEEAGGGSMPGIKLNGWAVKVIPENMSVNSLEESLRSWRVPIIARIQKEALLISPRTLLKGDADELAAAFAAYGSNG